MAPCYLRHLSVVSIWRNDDNASLDPKEQNPLVKETDYRIVPQSDNCLTREPCKSVSSSVNESHALTDSIVAALGRSAEVLDVLAAPSTESHKGRKSEDCHNDNHEKREDCWGLRIRLCFTGQRLALMLFVRSIPESKKGDLERYHGCDNRLEEDWP